MNRRKFLAILGIAPSVVATKIDVPAQETAEVVQAADDWHIGKTVTIVRDKHGRINKVVGRITKVVPYEMD